jgi:uroporphyrinogen decarboxylase
VLAAVQGAPFNLLHICGPGIYFGAVQDYPVRAINWAAVGQDNPTIAQAARLTEKAIIGGVDEDGALQSGTPEDVLEEARAAIRAAGMPGAAGISSAAGGRFLLSPGCGISMTTPKANLYALRKAAGG